VHGRERAAEGVAGAGAVDRIDRVDRHLQRARRPRCEDEASPLRALDDDRAGAVPLGNELQAAGAPSRVAGVTIRCD
jgi:hypothetical protein